MRQAYTDWIAVLERIERNDLQALAELSQLIVGWMRRYRAELHLDSADDIIQNVTLVILDHYRGDRLRAPEAFVAFVGAVVRNSIRDWIRKGRKADRSGVGENIDELEERLLADERRDSDPQVRVDLGKALGSLPDRERAVIEALYLQGHSYAEAADVIGVALGTLKRLQRQGLKALRALMEVDPTRDRSG